MTGLTKFISDGLQFGAALTEKIRDDAESLLEELNEIDELYNPLHELVDFVEWHRREGFLMDIWPHDGSVKDSPTGLWLGDKIRGPLKGKTEDKDFEDLIQEADKEGVEKTEDQIREELGGKDDEYPTREPWVGEPVHYVSHGSADGRYPSVCRAAIITETPNPDLFSRFRVNLAVFNPTGMHFDRGVRYLKDYGAERGQPPGGTWHRYYEGQCITKPLSDYVMSID